MRLNPEAREFAPGDLERALQHLKVGHEEGLDIPPRRGIAAGPHHPRSTPEPTDVDELQFEDGFDRCQSAQESPASSAPSTPHGASVSTSVRRRQCGAAQLWASFGARSVDLGCWLSAADPRRPPPHAVGWPDAAAIAQPALAAAQRSAAAAH